MINWYLAHIFIVSIALLLVPKFFIFPYFLGKKFDRIIQQHKLSLPKGLGIIPPHIVRTGIYAINIVIFPDPKKYPNGMKQYKRWFGNFCFREYASTWDKIQSWYIVLLSATVILSLFLSMLNSLIGYLISL
jgi:hypothetical protein